MNFYGNEVEEKIYRVVYIKDREETDIGKCDDIKSAIQLINQFLRSKNISVRTYTVTEKNDYTMLTNGKEVFRLYKI